MASGDVEKHQLVGPGLAVTAGQLDRIAGITQADEVHPLDHPAIGDIEARNDPFGNHGTRLKAG